MSIWVEISGEEEPAVTVIVPGCTETFLANILHNQMSVRMRYYLSWRDNVVVSAILSFEEVN